MVSRRSVMVGVFLALLMVWSLTPFYWIVRSSFMWLRDQNIVPPEWIPQNPTPANYLRVLGFHAIGPDGADMLPSGHAPFVKSGLLNSLLIAAPVALITVAIATPVGYAFARYQFRRKNTLLFTLLFARTLPPVAIAIPYYFLYFQSGLLGTHIGLIIIYLTMTVPLVTWVLVGFFGAIPKDIEWAARIDGLGRVQALLRVIIPVGAAGIAAVGILAFLLAWNEFMIAFVLVGGTQAQTIPVSLLGFFYMYSDTSAESAALTLSLIPPFIIALIFQRYITRLKIVDPVAVELK